MLRDNLVERIEPMLNSARADPLALCIHNQTQASEGRLPCLENPRPERADSSLTESASSPFQAEPAQTQLVKELNQLAIITDLVHNSEAGFFDDLEISGAPPIASHSNGRQIYDHFRNLTDAQIKAAGERNGVIGINFLSGFIHPEPQQATIDHLIAHLDYIAGLIGIAHVGLGPDFTDYILDLFEDWLIRNRFPLDNTKCPDGIGDVSGVPRLAEALASRGYSDQQIHQVLGGNFVRVYKQVLH